MKNSLTPIHKLLYPLSWIYGAAVGLRNKLFDWQILRSKSYGLPVICVGNISVGGTGKTPHTEYLIRLLQREGLQVATLSRGYKRKSKGYQLADERSNAQQLGDEPCQIKCKFPDIRVAVDSNRCNGIEELLKLKNPATDVILLDDAYQHRYVEAGLYILLTDYHRLWCDDALLPAGRLREPASGKERAHIVIVTKCPEEMKPIEFSLIASRLKLQPWQRLYFSCTKYGALKPTVCLTPQTEVLLVTGFAAPQPLIEEVQRRVRRVDVMTFADHHDFTSDDLHQINKRFQQLQEECRLLITTEKDAARLLNHPNLDAALKASIHVLPIEIEIIQNQQEHFNQQIIGYVTTNPRNSSFS